MHNFLWSKTEDSNETIPKIVPKNILEILNEMF